MTELSAAQIIKNGGYATAVNYVDVICSVIERWDLTQYDVQEDGTTISSSAVADTDNDDTAISNNKILYRVRTSWDNWQSQIGAFYILDNAKAAADENDGYSVYDEDGNVVY